MIPVLVHVRSYTRVVTSHRYSSRFGCSRTDTTQDMEYDIYTYISISIETIQVQYIYLYSNVIIEKSKLELQVEYETQE